MKLEAFKEFEINSNEIRQNQGGSMYDTCMSHGETVCVNRANDEASLEAAIEGVGTDDAVERCMKDVFNYCKQY